MNLEELNESVKTYLYNLAHLGHGDFEFYVNTITRRVKKIKAIYKR